MRTYARIDDGKVAELILPFAVDGVEVPVSDRFPVAVVQTLVDVTDMSPRPACGWSYDGSTFAPPVETVPEKTPDQIAAEKVAMVQAFMDAKARERNYDSIATAVTYAEEPAVPRFQAEGQAFRAWRSLVWNKCYEILDAVQAGTQAIPTDEELLAALPTLTLPS
jgi:hypothetical protein